MIRQDDLDGLLQRLLAEWESECVEFKEANDNFSTSEIGKYFSALGNEANLRDRDAAWLVFGVRNKTREVIGTDYRRERERLHQLKHQITQNTDPTVTFREIHELETAQGRVVLFEIPPAPHGIPIAWNGHYYARDGDSLGSLGLAKLDEIRAQEANDDWSAVICADATLDDLDPEAVAKLIYIDPPFDVGADFSMDIEIGGETFHKEPNLLEQIAYRDTWGRGADSFISMIYERLILMRDLLAEDGSVYVHMAPNMAPFIELAMNEVFGRERILGAIVWQRATAHGNVGVRYATVTDRIIVATRSENYVWGSPYQPYSKDYIESHYSSVEPGTGRRFTLRDVTAPMSRASTSQIYEWRGVRPVGTRCWSFTEKRMNELFEAGKIVFTGGKMPRMKLYLDEMPGIPATDLWNDLSAVNSQAREDTQYPTQKPEALLERIIQASSNPGDLVADFFCGSGTTAAVAEKLGRKWIATDLGKFGIHTTRKRLIGVQRELKAAEKDFRAFEVLNLGRYERQAYLNVGGRLTGPQKEQALAQKEREFRELILRAYKATGFGGGEGAPAQDGFFHGARNGRLVAIGPINLPVGRLFVEEVITECRKRGASRVDVLAFEFEMGLFPAVLEEARGKGIDLAPKYIPAEVFDKRAVDKGQVVFHDISFVEAMPRYDKKNKLALSIELTDFSVYYTQGAAEAAIANLKEGKNGVICDAGQLYKVSKSKEGIVTRERLTKHWTDWVDYWAVDFDYMSRQEIIKVPVGTGLSGVATLPGFEAPQGELALPQFEERWTGGYIFENEWQSFRTRQSRDLDLTTALHTYDRPGRYTVAVKVIDIFGNDTMTLIPVNVG